MLKVVFVAYFVDNVIGSSLYFVRVVFIDNESSHPAGVTTVDIICSPAILKRDSNENKTGTLLSTTCRYYSVEYTPFKNLKYFDSSLNKVSLSSRTRVSHVLLYSQMLSGQLPLRHTYLKAYYDCIVQIRTIPAPDVL